MVKILHHQTSCFFISVLNTDYGSSSYYMRNVARVNFNFIYIPLLKFPKQTALKSRALLYFKNIWFIKRKVL